MALNKNIFSGTVTGTQAIYLPIAGIKNSSFQFTHPGTGTIVFSQSNSTAPVNITNPAQMAGIGWSDLQITQPDGTKVYAVNFALPVWGTSPTTIPLECLNYQYLQIFITDTGFYSIDQHVNDLFQVHED